MNEKKIEEIKNIIEKSDKIHKYLDDLAKRLHDKIKIENFAFRDNISEDCKELIKIIDVLQNWSEVSQFLYDLSLEFKKFDK